MKAHRPQVPARPPSRPPHDVIREMARTLARQMAEDDYRALMAAKAKRDKDGK